jgi:DNA-binding response OmpR family regulator
MFKIIIAEDDLSVVELLDQVLIENGYKVCGVARTVDYAVDLIERHKPDFAILDLVLSDGCFGTEIPARLHSRDRPGIVYATGYPKPAEPEPKRL